MTTTPTIIPEERADLMKEMRAKYIRPSQLSGMALIGWQAAIGAEAEKDIPFLLDALAKTPKDE